ncbi:hypothetical protein ruthe_03165 [Rubellimicrobium thermophilum DSM 16684]|uniref:Uncharacterized protein n=1 Tax=Rubellimicrobium thermophilum DSM 16684 TaxID=1123069 RepID=S9QSX9_9RHOB|nr:hypothetical protein ruthe_03165 [Rubellimicrobium thermophilum DSM 16684]
MIARSGSPEEEGRIMENQPDGAAPPLHPFREAVDTPSANPQLSVIDRGGRVPPTTGAAAFRY